MENQSLLYESIHREWEKTKSKEDEVIHALGMHNFLIIERNEMEGGRGWSPNIRRRVCACGEIEWDNDGKWRQEFSTTAYWRSWEAYLRKVGKNEPSK